MDRDRRREPEVEGAPALDDGADSAPAEPRVVAQQVLGEGDRVGEADADRAVGPHGAAEQAAAGRVVQVDLVLVREHELEPPERVPRARLLAQPERETLPAQAPPVDGAGVELDGGAGTQAASGMTSSSAAARRRPRWAGRGDGGDGRVMAAPIRST